jgi:mRNA deadenylase 3'-5' endonuclease subunit Ccr4
MSFVEVIRYVIMILFFLIFVDSFIKTGRTSVPYFTRSKNHHSYRTYLVDNTDNSILDESPSSSSSSSLELKLISFNILAPCYNKPFIDNIYESHRKEVYIKRNHDICNLLLQSDADIICLQEFWTDNNDIRSLYQNRLGKYVSRFS